MADCSSDTTDIPLLEWANIGLSNADDEMRRIYRIEQQACPIPREGKNIRNLITRLEICHFKCERHVLRILRSIGQMNPELDPYSIGNSHPRFGEKAWHNDRTGRSRRGQEFIWILQMWLDGARCLDRDSRGIPEITFQKVYAALGKHDVRKTVLVSALLDRLLWKFGENRQPLPEGLADFREQIDRTDICHYSFPSNVEHMIHAIGNLEPVPDFVGCGSFDRRRRRMAEKYFEALCTWLRGKKSSLDMQLGSRTPVKEWLAACLAKTLKELAGLQAPMPE